MPSWYSKPELNPCGYCLMKHLQFLIFHNPIGCFLHSNSSNETFASQAPTLPTPYIQHNFAFRKFPKNAYLLKISHHSPISSYSIILVSPLNLFGPEAMYLVVKALLLSCPSCTYKFHVIPPQSLGNRCTSTSRYFFIANLYNVWPCRERPAPALVVLGINNGCFLFSRQNHKFTTDHTRNSTHP